MMDVPQELQQLDPRTRLVIVQAGGYGRAVERFARGEDEDYYAQRYTVELVAELAHRVEQVAVLSFLEDVPLHQLDNGVFVGGVQVYPEAGKRHLELLRMASSLNPTHAVLGAPLWPLVAWSLTRRMRVITLFADSFNPSSVRERLKHAAMAKMLNRNRFAWVANHNLAASLDLVKIGVQPDKVIPYDWPASMTPSELPAKTESGTPFRLIYVGMMCEDKGVGDALRAIDVLRRRGHPATLTLVGGDAPEVRREIERLQLADRVRFAGRLPHAEIVPLMHAHDAVLVPTRHSYPEGLPMTIYEGLCSRSPLIVSDHPMFRLRMRDGETGLVFRAGSEEHLADAVEKLMRDPALYARLSEAATRTAEGYLCPVKWHTMLGALLSPEEETRRSVAPFSLAGKCYGDVLQAVPAL